MARINGVALIAQDAAVPVRRTLLKRRLLGGLPVNAWLFIGPVTVGAVMSFGQWIFLIIMPILVIVARLLVKNDPFMLEILAENLQRNYRIGR